MNCTYTYDGRMMDLEKRAYLVVFKAICPAASCQSLRVISLQQTAVGVRVRRVGDKVEFGAAWATVRRTGVIDMDVAGAIQTLSEMQRIR